MRDELLELERDKAKLLEDVAAVDSKIKLLKDKQLSSFLIMFPAHKNDCDGGVRACESWNNSCWLNSQINHNY